MTEATSAPAPRGPTLSSDSWRSEIRLFQGWHRFGQRPGLTVHADRFGLISAPLFWLARRRIREEIIS